ncbi:MAG: bifunctional phosphoribosyl-AMP cyclohydrolase/phosphoribosyl-ATP diphosphatase HisIE [Saprospiraceae bacterium]|nr:bifunctional phosphoribosyl-AMP cyclohydrolase/phosphoribosyl-ATP diphosphatase HisIE [Saprospiraceae bacterium]
MVDINKIDFEKSDGLIPVIAQDANTGKVLMLGFANREAVELTVQKGLLTFYSRSKNRIWTKGEESGNYLKLVSLQSDCDNDTILAKVLPSGPVCHTGADTCWGETNEDHALSFIDKLEQIIEERKLSANPSNSYVASLFAKGKNKIAQKVGEEAVELIIESIAGNTDALKNEAADLLFHFLILLQSHDLRLRDVVSVLEQRNS